MNEAETTVTRTDTTDEDDNDPASLCGRLMAVLVSLQMSLEGEACQTRGERRFEGALLEPSAHMPWLVALAKKVDVPRARSRHDSEEVEDRIAALVLRIGCFPERLNAAQQGAFVIGYYRQRAEELGNE